MKIYSKVAIVLISVFLSLTGCKDKDNIPDSLSVSPKELTNIPAQGQTTEFSVTSTQKWTVSGIPDWVTLNPSSGESGTTKVSVTVKPSMQKDERSATLVFSGGSLSEKLTLKQVGANILVVSMENLKFNFDGGTEHVELTATSDWTATSSEAWCTLNKSNGTGSDVINIMAATNSSDERKAVITFKMGNLEKKIEVTQGAESLVNILANERKILEDFYRQANGDKWSQNDGWMNPNVKVGDWFGIDVNAEGRVKSISFVMNNLSGKISPEICKLAKLEKLEINMAIFDNSTFPENIGDLTELVNLTVKQAGIAGELPASISKLKKLQVLSIENNFLTGSLPAGIGELANLNEIAIDRNGFSGAVPESWKKLTNLQYVYFSFNSKLTGSIDVFYNLPKLKRLSLNGCGFSGEISTKIGNLKLLETINLAGNNFTGNLPKELVASPVIGYFDVELNRLTGEIPDEILKHPKIDWQSKYHWRRICHQQDGYGFTNCPPNPAP